jgi:hypothetical protein
MSAEPILKFLAMLGLAGVGGGALRKLMGGDDWLRYCSITFTAIIAAAWTAIAPSTHPAKSTSPLSSCRQGRVMSGPHQIPCDQLPANERP